VNRLARATSGAALALVATFAAHADGFDAPRITGFITDVRLADIRGLAAARPRHDRLWLHNDSGDSAELYTIDTDGVVRGRVVIDGVKPIDWEDIAAFELDGHPYLLIGDVGDNGGVRKSYELVVIEEPTLADGADVRVRPAWRLKFRYTDAPHDCEAIAVDAQRREVLLLTKRTDPSQVWSVPLRSDAAGTVDATQRGTLALPALAASSAASGNAVGVPRTAFRPTGFGLSPRNDEAVVLTYRGVMHYRRAAGTDWATALATTPVLVPIALIAQAEAIGFDRNGRGFYVTGEKWPTPLLRVDGK
jgi:hypothetical protein